MQKLEERNTYTPTDMIETMSKRIWFVQQKPFDYLPLRAGLGLISEDELRTHPGFSGLCPKIYTTRTRPMQGEYYVVEGSRFKAKPVEPRIEFMATPHANLNLRTGVIGTDKSICRGSATILDYCSQFHKYTFPELDLGIKGSSFSDLKGVLLKLNPKSTVDSPFYVSRLEPLNVE